MRYQMSAAPSGDLLCITCISLLVARARQLVPTLDLFHQTLVLKNQAVPPCSIAESHIQPSNPA